MKHTWKKLVIIVIAMTALMSIPAIAQQDESDVAAPPPIPPKVPNEELASTVTISEKQGERIEEYSRDGRVYMVKITPIRGPAYWYLDENGDGQLELANPDNGEGRVRPVYWKIKEW